MLLLVDFPREGLLLLLNRRFLLGLLLFLLRHRRLCVPCICIFGNLLPKVVLIVAKRTSSVFAGRIHVVLQIVLFVPFLQLRPQQGCTLLLMLVLQSML